MSAASLRRRDLLLATGLTLVFGSAAQRARVGRWRPALRIQTLDAALAVSASCPHRRSVQRPLSRRHRPNPLGHDRSRDFSARPSRKSNRPGLRRDIGFSRRRRRSVGPNARDRPIGLSHEENKRDAGRKNIRRRGKESAPGRQSHRHHARRKLVAGGNRRPQNVARRRGVVSPLPFHHLDSGPVRNWTIDLSEGGKALPRSRRRAR